MTLIILRGVERVGVLGVGGGDGGDWIPTKAAYAAGDMLASPDAGRPAGRWGACMPPSGPRRFPFHFALRRLGRGGSQGGGFHLMHCHRNSVTVIP